MMKNHAFTLVELLVVIAILAILAAILFPVFGQAKRAAHGSACLSNQRQQLVASQLYVGDYDEHLPYAASWGDAWIKDDCKKVYPPTHVSVHLLYTPGRSFKSLVSSYAKGEGIWWCPATDISTPMPRSACTLKENETTYFWNHATPATVTRPLTLVSGLPESAILSPSEAMLTTDILQWGVTSPNGGGTKPPHFNRAIVGYADGHVRSVPMTANLDVWQDRGWWGWPNDNR